MRTTTTHTSWLGNLGDTLITSAWLLLGIVLWLICGDPPQTAASAAPETPKATPAAVSIPVRHHHTQRRSQSHCPAVEHALQAALQRAEPGDWAPLERAHFDPHWMVERVN